MKRTWKPRRARVTTLDTIVGDVEVIEVPG
jgi:hypothetical protein